MKDAAPHPAVVRPPKLRDRLRRCLRDNHYSLRTERAYAYWARWYIRFHGLRHPIDMGGPEIQAFLSYLVNERQIAGATYIQAPCALLVSIGRCYLSSCHGSKASADQKAGPAPDLFDPARDGTSLCANVWLYGVIARLLYGTGMRLMECAQLRVKDVEFQRRDILVREGKGGRDRVTMLPLSLVQPLREQIAHAKLVDDRDRLSQRNGVMRHEAWRQPASAGTGAILVAWIIPALYAIAGSRAERQVTFWPSVPIGELALSTRRGGEAIQRGG